MYVKGQAGSGRHNTCIVVERKKEDGCMNECGNVEAIDLSGRRRYARRFVRYLFSKKCANVNDVNVPNNLFPLFYFVFSTIIESSALWLTMLKVVTLFPVSMMLYMYLRYVYRYQHFYHYMYLVFCRPEIEFWTCSVFVCRWPKIQ